MAASEFIFEETRKYVRQRKAFGGTVADLQVTRRSSGPLAWFRFCVSASVSVFFFRPG